jgi:L-phenylalanine/L-methionine N-acetyltransferase
MIIRHAELSDLQGIKAIYQQEHAFSNTLQLPYQSDSLWEERLKKASNNHYSLVAISDSNEIIGQISLITIDIPRRRHVVTFGMGVSISHTGKGGGGELLKSALDMADNWLNINRVELEVYCDNTAAVKLYQKLGFEIEGTAKNYAFKNGEYVDSHFMARLK